MEYQIVRLSTHLYYSKRQAVTPDTDILVRAISVTLLAAEAKVSSDHICEHPVSLINHSSTLCAVS